MCGQLSDELSRLRLEIVIGAGKRAEPGKLLGSGSEIYIFFFIRTRGLSLFEHFITRGSVNRAGAFLCPPSGGNSGRRKTGRQRRETHYNKEWLVAF